MPINTLTSDQTFKEWFNKTNEIISLFNVQQAIGVTGISAGVGISLGYGSGKNIISLKDTIPGITVSGNINIQGNATVTGSLSVSSLSVNTTTISYTPKLAGLTSGNIVAIAEFGGLTLAKANTAENAEVFGVVIGEDATSTLVAVAGKIDNSAFNKTIENSLGVNGATLFPGIAYFLSPTVSGGLTTIEPTGYGQVSKPVLLGITGDSGVILPYRGYVIEGISAGLTAELDNKIIISVKYNVDGAAKKDAVAVKPGDPVYYLGESVSAADRTAALVGVGTSDIKLCGGSNSNNTSNTVVLKTASPLSLRSYCIGAVSSVLLDDTGSSTMILEIITRGGSFKIDLDDLDSNVYDATGTIGGIYKFDNSTLFKPQSPATPTNTSWATIIKNNDPDNTAIFILNHTEYDNSGSVSGFAPASSIVVYDYQGISGGITLTSSYDLLTNGTFSVWQRGDTSYTGATLASLGTYYTTLCDRWFVGTHGCSSINLTFSKGVFSSNQTTVLGSPLFYVNYSNTFATKTAGSLVQRPKLENISKGARLLAGQTATIAFYAKAGISGASLDVFYNRYNDSYTTTLGLTSAIESRVIVNTPGITLTGDWKEYSVTFTPNSGITLSSNEEGWFGVGFEFPNTTTYSLSQVRFNVGNSPTQPIHINLDKELQECKKYYQSSYTYGYTAQTIGDYNLNEASLDLNNLVALKEYTVQLPVKMYGTPKTVKIYSTDSGVLGEAYNVSASQDLRNTNGTLIKVPWSLPSPYRTTAKITNNIYVNTIKSNAFTVVIDGGAYSTDRIKFHWIADADFDKFII